MQGLRLGVFAAIGVGIAVALWAGLDRVAGPKTETGATPEPALEGPPPAPFAIGIRHEDLGALLETSSFVHKGDAPGGALYVIGFRTCPNCLIFKAAETERLDAAGVDARWIIYARRDRDGKERSRPEERALVAEIALTRSYALYEAWHAGSPDNYYQTTELPPAAESAPERLAALEAGRALVDRLSEIVSANGHDMEIPSLFWQEDGAWYAMIGYDEAAFAPVRERLGARPALPQGD